MIKCYIKPKACFEDCSFRYPKRLEGRGWGGAKEGEAKREKEREKLSLCSLQHYT